MDIAFSQAYMNNYMIDITPEAAEPTWARVGAGISSVDPDGNEELDQQTYIDGEGLASTDVTGGQMILAFDGHRCIGDPAQDYIVSKKFTYGTNRKTRFRWINPEGDILNAKVTIANVKVGGGDANAKEPLSFEIHVNGLPEYIAGNKTEFPTSITASAVSVSVGEAASATVTVAPEHASDNVFFAVENTDIATVAADGTVRGIAAGETELTVKSAVLPSVSNKVKITVTDR